MKENKVINLESRKIVNTYTLENGYRVKVSTYHFTSHKVIRSTISECIAREERGYTMETHRLYSDLSQVIISEKVSRYSFKALEQQHAKALEIAAPLVEQLIEAGKENGRDCQKEVA